MTGSTLQPPTSDTPDLPEGSRFLQRLRRRYGDLLPLLAPTGMAPLDHAQLGRTYTALRERGMDTARALRVLRQLVLERLITDRKSVV